MSYRDKKLIHLICAARPNFMKIAPLYHALRQEDWVETRIVHTGQHYDLQMSSAFFQDFGLSEPDIHLGVGSGTHAEQTGRVMMSYEKVLIEEKPDLVVVVGDVNSTVAASLAASKLGIKVAHLEAGLRSFDRTMPEEINRIITDALADLLWTPSPDADENLLREGIQREKIKRVGNIMIDSLEMLRGRIETESTYMNFGLSPGRYGLVTLHRPANVDTRATLEEICRALIRVSEKTRLFFPVHPRTMKHLQSFNLLPLLKEGSTIKLSGPLNYISFMNLVFHCNLLITDSGGLQEETTYLGIPCITLRPNTERPITITQGTNRLCSVKDLESMSREIRSNRRSNGIVLDLWDGKTSNRVVKSIERFFFEN